MIKRIKSLARSSLIKRLSEEKGGFSLESAIVLPTVLTLILTFILFGIYMYQKVMLYYSASVTAERTAFSWDNSNRESRSGMLANGQYDSLYWRLSENHALVSLFGLSADDSSALLTLPSAGDRSGLTLPSRKLDGGSQWLSTAGNLNAEGQIAYLPSLLKPQVEVKLKQPVSLAPLEAMLGKKEPKSAASAVIVDPVEFIRTVDLVRYYNYKASQAWSGSQKANAGQTLSQYGGQTGGGRK
ncbi:TadE/TadG family type IV pilus assembly protein [Paenibacillus sp. NEAU-GSW1]|uniref:TadE/TadG family type IV pilus assembly protein n=1 Tax=Paenibacillus sp. NEAU-GSW1 TaxID=2682486 RepID=UPI0012E2993A|nr:TadE family protein [Paenibacillus sp. NEAU-GSW1]MUT68068.1 pilus assembly protein [Paenibacillus sp. NEAU-GSW1]